MNVPGDGKDLMKEQANRIGVEDNKAVHYISEGSRVKKNMKLDLKIYNSFVTQ